MNLFFEVSLMGLILCLDSFSAALAMGGGRPFTRQDAVKFAFISGGAEGLVALVGALVGKEIVSRFSAIDHWIAFGLLFLVALHMAYEGIKELMQKKDESHTPPEDFHSLFKQIVVSFATSLDALGVGIGLGVAQKPIFAFSLSIGLWAFAATLAGLALGKRLSEHFSSYFNFLGSIILGILAFQMLKI